MDAYHSRDIPENSLSKSVNVQLTQNGSIELIASPETKINLSGDFFFDSINTFDYLQGHQIFHFKSDFALSQKVKVLSLKQEVLASDTMRVYTNFPHGFKAGITITLSGVHKNFQGHHQVYHVADPYSFDIFTTDHLDNKYIIHGDLTTQLLSGEGGSALTMGASLDNDKEDTVLTLVQDTINASQGLVGSLIKIDTEIMLVTGKIDEGPLKYKVQRGWPDGSNGLASHSTVPSDIYWLGDTLEDDPKHIEDNYSASVGYAHYHEEVGETGKDLFIIMNGSKVCLTDGNIFLRNITDLSSSYSPIYNNSFLHLSDKHKNNSSYTFVSEREANIFPDGEISPSFVKTDNGILISALVDNEATEHNIDVIHPKLIKYMTPQKRGTGYANLVDTKANYGHTAFDYTNVDTSIAATDGTLEFVAENSADTIARFVVSHSTNLTVQNGSSYTVSFHIGREDPNTIYTNQIDLPVIYFSEDSSANDGEIARSSQFKAKLGYNSFTFTCESGVFSTDNKLGDDYIHTSGSGSTTTYLIFETYRRCSYRVKDLTVHQGCTVSNHGWYGLQTGSDGPVSVYTEEGNTVTETVNSPIAFYIALNSDTGVDNGHWNFTDMTYERIKVGVSYLRYESETEGEIQEESHGSSMLSDNDLTGTVCGLRGAVRYTIEGSSTKGIPVDIIGFKLYMTGHGSGSAKDLDDPLLLGTFYFDQSRKSKLFNKDIPTWTMVNTLDQNATFTGISTIPATSYMATETGVNHDLAERRLANVLFGSACTVNGITYIGNIMRVPNIGGSIKKYPDTMMKSSWWRNTSHPTYFPSENRNILDLYMGDDGDEIIHLLSWENLVFQFKRNIVNIWEVTENGDDVPKTSLKGVGIKNKSSATSTVAGIAWVNETGCFMYDGEQMNNIMRGQIKRTKWRDNFSEGANIGFSAPDQAMICVGRNTTYIYSFTDEHWIESDLFGIGNFSSNIVSTSTGAMWYSKHQRHSTEEAIIDVTTLGVAGRRATHRISNFDADGNIDDSDTNGYELWHKDSSGNPIQISDSFVSGANDLIPKEQLNLLLDKLRSSDALYGFNAVWGTLHPSAGSEIEGTKLILGTRFFNTAFNTNVSYINATTHNATYLATSSGSAGDFGDFNAEIDNYGSDNWGQKTDRPSGWNYGQSVITPTAGVRKIIINRNSQDTGGVVYHVTIDVYKQRECTEDNVGQSYAHHCYGHLAISDETDNCSGCVAQNFWDYVDRYTFTYTTAYGDDDDAVRDGIGLLMNNNIDFSNKFTIDTSTAKTVQLTSNIVDARGANYNGHYWIMGPDYSVPGGLTVDVMGSTIGYTLPPQAIVQWVPFNDATANYFNVATYDVFSGSVGQRKKVYKIYITYKSTGDSGVKVQFVTDGKNWEGDHSANKKEFTGVANYTNSSLDDTSGDWKVAELKPSSVSDMKNVYSFKILFYNAGLTSPSDFSINDISIVYRVKNVK